MEHNFAPDNKEFLAHEINELYKQKKMLGRGLFERLRRRYIEILNNFEDIIQHKGIDAVLKRNANEDRISLLRVAIERAINDPALNEVKNNIAFITSKIEALEKSGVVGDEVLKVEAGYKGDDLHYRPIHEWFDPLLDQIKK